MIRIVLIFSLIFLIEIHAVRRRCINSGVLLPDKIFRSPIVVYGEPIGKRVSVDTDIDLLYNITFRVDCVFKGQDVENKIEITEAGIKSGHTACQWLDPGHFYVVFLEKWGLNANGYRPLDFQERLIDNMTTELLAKTCHLSRIQPLHSTANTCPNVSWVGYCPHDGIDVNVMPRQPQNFDTINHVVKSSYFNDDNQFYRQSNVTIPQGRYILEGTGKISSNSACLFSITWISMIMITIMILFI